MLAYVSHGVIRELVHAVQLALADAKSGIVRAILPRGGPSQILKPVVQLVAVEVCTPRAHRARPSVSLKDQMMNQAHPTLKIDSEVSVIANPELHYLGCRAPAPLTVPPGSNVAQVGHVVMFAHRYPCLHVKQYSMVHLHR